MQVAPQALHGEAKRFRCVDLDEVGIGLPGVVPLFGNPPPVAAPASGLRIGDAVAAIGRQPGRFASFRLVVGYMKAKRGLHLSKKPTPRRVSGSKACWKISGMAAAVKRGLFFPNS